MKCFLTFCTCICFSSQVCCGAIIWDYSSTDEVTTLSGRLTTDGNPSDLASSGNFNLLSVDTVLLNGVLVSPETFHSAGSPPPFAYDVSGYIAWDTVDGVVGTPDWYLIAWDEFHFNRIYLATAPLTNVNSHLASSTTGQYLAWFDPTSTLFSPTPVPEPSTVLLLATGLLVIGGYAARRHRRENSAEEDRPRDRSLS